MRLNPHLFEINAFWLLRRLAAKEPRPLTLAAIPEGEWKSLRASGFDIVWLMGVWKRSPGARQKALKDPTLREAYTQALPGWTEKDVTGSPYAINEYSLDPSLGGEGELAELKDRLNRLGLKLMLDFVPNHLAFDHPWTLSHPEYFIRAPDSGCCGHPEWFFEAKSGVFLAHGRDPYFPPWSDTVQVNYFSPAAREAMMEELERIAEVSDGVRCDMAMLAISDIFKKVWGPVTGRPKPEKEFWGEAIARLRRKRPDFIFMAEAYWNTEYPLQQMGFDFTYDKILYDRLLHSDAREVRAHLQADSEYQKRSARFIENHDEKPAAGAFGSSRSLAAAGVAATIPGLRFFYDGQREGRRAHVPIQLGREPQEKNSLPIFNFYQRLMKTVDGPAYHEGNWKLLSVNASSENNNTFCNLLAWSWELGPEMELIMINDSAIRSQGRVTLPRKIRGSRKISFFDRLRGTRYFYLADEINEKGIYVDLNPWNAHIMKGPVLEKEGRK